MIGGGQGWMHMLADRNRISHSYNEETAEAKQHHPLLKELQHTLSARVEPSA